MKANKSLRKLFLFVKMIEKVRAVYIHFNCPCIFKILLGRDSVLAMRKRNDLAPKYDVTQEEIDEDLIWRIEALLIKSQSYIDIPELRQAFQTRDTQKSGKVEAVAVRLLCLRTVNSRYLKSNFVLN